MNNTEQNLSELFDIQPNEPTEENLPVEVKEGEVITKQEPSNDFDLVRNNINSLIEKGNTAIDNLLHVAKETEHPRAYEVAANFLKTMADLNKDLLDIHKKKKDLNVETGSNDKPLIDKAVFVGTTSELIKIIRSNK